MKRADVCIVGGGLIGLAAGRALTRRFPGIEIVIFEKERRPATHQSSRNSGVVHSGLYYRPGSLKARLCVEGRDELYRLCAENDIAHRRSGKLVVATKEAELPALDELERRGRSNGLRGLERLGRAGLRALEPAATGVAALHVPEAGVADFEGVAHHLAGELTSVGATIAAGHAVAAIDHVSDGVVVTAGGRRHAASLLINCAGLYADRVARLAGIDPSVSIIPFRGEYFRMSDPASGLVRNLVYPVPDPRFPFLGVHFTRRVDDTVEVGPNAVLALGREQYRGSPAVWSDVREIVTDAGFRRLARAHWSSGVRELLASRSRRLYARMAARLIPGVRAAHLRPGGSGIRAQAVARDGSLVDDFVIEQVGATLHVLNAPSPGATASLAIGREIATRAAPLLNQ